MGSKKNIKKKNEILSFQPNILVESWDEKIGSKNLKKDLAIYIHIPFCVSKCSFCSIATYRYIKNDDMKNYIGKLEKELNIYRELIITRNITCIHFGGGTPSLMNADQINQLMIFLSSIINDFENIEVVFEAHPNSLDEKKLNVLESFGNVSINLGIQTFDHTLQYEINRRHDNEKLITLIKKISKMNFRSIGIDLICNLPGADKRTTINDIDIAITCGISHIALYPLRIEPGCLLYEKYEKYISKIADFETQIENFEFASDYLRKNNFENYSIYHFTTTEKLCHIYGRNQIMGAEWIGIGAGAVGYFNNMIVKNTSDLKLYLKNEIDIQSISYLNESEKIIREFIYLLRKKQIDKRKLLKKYGENIMCLFQEIMIYLQKNAYIEESENIFSLTPLGILSLTEIETALINKYFIQRVRK